MDYHTFITNIKKIGSERITALSFPDSCATRQIPNAFVLLFPNICGIIYENLHKLSPDDHVIAFFGIQVCSFPIIFNFPKQLNRIFKSSRPDCYFCCNLNYLTLGPKDYTRMFRGRYGEVLNKPLFPRDIEAVISRWLN